MTHDPDTLFRRRAAADALSAAGFPIRPATLACMATRGGGPLYRLYGRIPLYRWGDLMAWAELRLSLPVRSTSEGDVQAALTVAQRHRSTAPPVKEAKSDAATGIRENGSAAA